MNRRNFFKGLLGAVATGVALTASQTAAADLLGLNKYAEMVRLQQDVIALHTSVLARVDTSKNRYAYTDDAMYKAEMPNKIDHLLGYAMDNFKGDANSAEALEECRKIFNDRNYADTMSEDGLRKILEVIVPIAVARNLLAVNRIMFDPNKMQNWDRFSDLYTAMILQA